MKSLYRIWKVYETGLVYNIRWYVVNQITRKVQSSWKHYDAALRITNDLNRFAIQVVKTISRRK